MAVAVAGRCVLLFVIAVRCWCLLLLALLYVGCYSLLLMRLRMCVALVVAICCLSSYVDVGVADVVVVVCGC